MNIYPSVEIMIPWNLSIGDYATVGDGATLYALGQIRIGSGATVSQGAHLCAGTHDYEAAAFTLIKSSVTIEDRAWICADAFVGPGVTIGKGAVVAARAVAVKSVEDWAVVGGNPAKMIKVRLMRD
ncbi:MAG: putative colanic acid biosynthesis acetyltransferase [Opitutae bacterium]|nr:putative colanic acid biosynthesis acetyltransferase [Opitutae bacterium]